MTRASAFMLVLCAVTWSAEAMFVQLSEEELIEQSEFIVVGELIGRATVNLEPSRAPLVLGVIRVEEALKGEPGVTLLLLALPGRGLPGLSTDLQYPDGQRGLWFLRLRNPGEQGIYAADHPQRFLPIGEAGEQIEALKRRLER